MPFSGNTRFLVTAAAVAALSLSLTTAVFADEDAGVAAKIAHTIKAAPTDITDNATIVDGDGTVLREGSNGWTCMPGIPLLPGHDFPMCNDATWTAWLKAMAAGEAFSTDVVGVSYMLAGDAPVNNDDPSSTDPNDGGPWITEGPHLMMLMPAEVRANLSNDPQAGGLYVMWADTPLVHVMVPVGERPE